MFGGIADPIFVQFSLGYFFLIFSCKKFLCVLDIGSGCQMCNLQARSAILCVSF